MDWEGGPCNQLTFDSAWIRKGGNRVPYTWIEIFTARELTFNLFYCGNLSVFSVFNYLQCSFIHSKFNKDLLSDHNMTGAVLGIRDILVNRATSGLAITDLKLKIQVHFRREGFLNTFHSSYQLQHSPLLTSMKCLKIHHSTTKIYFSTMDVW